MTSLLLLAALSLLVPVTLPAACMTAARRVVEVFRPRMTIDAGRSLVSWDVWPLGSNLVAPSVRGRALAGTDSALASGCVGVVTDPHLRGRVAVDAAPLGVAPVPTTGVLFLGDDLKMLDIDAPPVATKVVYDEPVGDGPTKLLDDPSVRSAVPALSPEDPVAPGRSALPNVTTGLFIENPEPIKPLHTHGAHPTGR